MKKLLLSIFVLISAAAVNAEQVAQLSLKTKSEKGMAFTWVSSNPTQTEGYVVRIYSEENELVAQIATVSVSMKIMPIWTM